MTDLLSQLEQQRLSGLDQVVAAAVPEPTPADAPKPQQRHKVKVYCPPAPRAPVDAATVFAQLQEGPVELQRSAPSERVQLRLEKHPRGHLLITRTRTRGTLRRIQQARYDEHWSAPVESRSIVRWPANARELEMRLRMAW